MTQTRSENQQRLGRQLSQDSACCKLENLNLSPRTHVSGFVSGVYVVISPLCRQRQLDPWGSLASLLVLVQARERPCLKKARWTLAKE